MKKIDKKSLLLLSFVVTFHGCSSLIPNSMLRASHQDIDTNHDGYVDFQEYLKTGSEEDVMHEAKAKGMTKKKYLQWDFNRADENKDGKVSAQEFINMANKEL